ncbi:MAG: hypothetical protein HY787_01115 [Deltaproteobacteria bacterium]|nr:hypothetical protein [Deltaproteobacteria bacterium]
MSWHSSIGRWWTRQGEIDLVALDRSGQKVNRPEKHGFPKGNLKP